MKETVKLIVSMILIIFGIPMVRIGIHSPYHYIESNSDYFFTIVGIIFIISGMIVLTYDFFKHWYKLKKENKI